MSGLWKNVFQWWKSQLLSASKQKLCQRSKTRLTERENKIHETHQSDDEYWKRLNKEMDRAIDMVTIQSFNISSIQSIIVTEFKTSSSQKVPYQNLMSIGMFKMLFPIQQW